MVIFRLIAIAVLLLVFLALAPLQWLARRLNLAAARLYPVALARSLCWALQIRPRLHGQQSAARAQLVVANHISWADILVLSVRAPQGFLAKQEVGRWPVFGFLARLQGTVFVNRNRRRSIPAANRQMALRMQEGTPVVLFAEATTSDGTRIKPFRSSHFAAARDLLALDPALDSVTIQPVAIFCTRRNGLALSRAGRADLAWYGEMTLLPHVWRLLSGGPVDCDVIFAEPLAFRRGDDRKLAARAAEQSVRAAAAAAMAGRLPVTTAALPANQPAVSILLQTKTA